MTDTAIFPISSGMPYTLTRFDGSTPTAVSDFLGDSSFVAHWHEKQLVVVGVGILDDPGTGVRFYQKDAAHDGRDVRVWQIRTDVGHGFTAEHRAAI